jgi:hypothetical protein
MNYRDVYIAEETMERLVEERLRQAKAARLARQIRPQRQSSVQRLVLSLLPRARQLLALASRRPEQDTVVKTTPLRGQS